jgi:hypothetical protein
MASYSAKTMNAQLEGRDDIQKIKSYLYQLNEELDYMFNNLETDNLTDEAYLLMRSNGSDTSSLEMEVDKIKLQVESANSGVSSLTMKYNNISLAVSEKVDKNGVLQELNSELEISSNRIYMGTTGQLVISAGNFQLDEDGNVVIAGDIVGGSTIEVGELYADDNGVTLGSFYTYTASSGGKYLALKDTQAVGIGDYPDFNIWAGAYSANFNNPYFYVKNTGETHAYSIVLWSDSNTTSPFTVGNDGKGTATMTLNGNKVYPVVSVTALPDSPRNDTIYLIQGTVSVS